MKLSTNSQLSLQIMLDLAIYGREEHVKLASIAKRVQTNIRNLEPIAVMLRKAGCIHSVKGPQGGYRLLTDPNNIRIGDLLRLVEGDMLVIDPKFEFQQEDKIRQCIRENIYDPMNKQIADAIDCLTLADLISIYQYKQSSEFNMYYI